MKTQELLTYFKVRVDNGDGSSVHERNDAWAVFVNDKLVQSVYVWNDGYAGLFVGDNEYEMEVYDLVETDWNVRIYVETASSTVE